MELTDGGPGTWQETGLVQSHEVYTLEISRINACMMLYSTEQQMLQCCLKLNQEFSVTSMNSSAGASFLSSNPITTTSLPLPSDALEFSLAQQQWIQQMTAAQTA